MTAFSLIFFPAEADAEMPGPDELAGHLQQTGLAGSRIRGNDFLAGERFLDLVMFMGCSPNIELGAGDETDACSRIRIMSEGGRMLCRIAPSKRGPRCPACNAPLGEDIADVIMTSGRCEQGITCTSCSTVSMPWDLLWQKNAGFGHCLVEITNIYPQEAIPQQSLLDDLQKATGTAWRYFYMQY